MESTVEAPTFDAATAEGRERASETLASIRMPQHVPDLQKDEPVLRQSDEQTQPLAASESRSSAPNDTASESILRPELSSGTPQPSMDMSVDPPAPSSAPASQNQVAPRLPPVSYIDSQTNQMIERPLNVTDALSYLDAVKMQFHDQPDVYNHFLDIMKDFKSQLIDTPGVIKRVSHLFNGHPSLIQGFNTFLPPGYRIECSTDGHDASFITVTTPTGTTMQTTNDGPGKGPILWSTSPMTHPGEGPGYAAMSPDPSMYGALEGQAIEPAVQYVQKIKQRCDPDTYKQFLEILSRYHHKPDTIDEREVSAQISRLFKDAPDLRSDFRIFMPEKSQALFDNDEEIFVPTPRRSTPSIEAKTSSRNKAEQAQMASALPQKRKRKPVEVPPVPSSSKVVPPAKKAKQQQHLQLPGGENLSYSQHHVGPSSPRRTNAPSSRGVVDDADETHFFDRVKRALDSRETYNEFLKLVNLFTQGFIDTARLVRDSRTYLGDGALMRQFREILGWDERKERDIASSTQDGWVRHRIAGGGALDRPSRAELNMRYGSYRRLPATEVNVTCSGRDEMCRSVLNDEWVSHPSWSSEDSGFVAHKKNVYEEALHRSEEERHEYDFHIEALVRTIGMLEPISTKIAQLPPDERGAFKLKPNLGGAAKSIHQRVVRKIYGREAGAEVLEAMQNAPALAIPLVLARLKQKEEEWKRAQREWNKVWREVDARNYRKSLDHQGIAVKAADKKAFSTKAFVSQIEAAREEQMARRASLIDPLFARTRPQHQLEFVFADVCVLQDALKLALSFLDRTQGQINLVERRRIEAFLRSFVPLFFIQDPTTFNAAFAVVVQEAVAESEASGDEAGSVVDEADASSVVSGSSRTGRSSGRKSGAASNGGDLRKRLLKSEQAKSTNRKTRAQEADTSRPASPAIPDAMQIDGEDSAPNESSTATAVPDAADATGQSRRLPRRNVFFGNAIFYALLRLLEVLYSRLLLFKTTAARLVAESNTDRPNPVATELGLLSSAEIASTSNHSANAEHFYDLMLESCERLFDNEIEQTAFEDQMRYMFGNKEAYKIFTIDKLIGALIKQVQTVLSDTKSQELHELLKRDRALTSPTTQDQINSRRSAEKILGPDENLFRIDWLVDSSAMTVQLFGKDDSRFGDSEVLTGRWQAYIDSFVSKETTEGLPPARLKRPFLRKSLSISADGSEPDAIARGGLEIRVCVRTYRLFFVSKTEDFLCRIPSREEVQKAREGLRTRNAQRMKRLKWIEEGGLKSHVQEKVSS